MLIDADALKHAAAIITATAALGGALLWLFREKVSSWVREQTAAHGALTEARLKSLEESHNTHEGELMRIADAMERTSTDLSESFKRLTVSLERIVDKHEETALAVARIEGHIEKRATAR